MSGIHVSNVNDEVTEKALKVHFSNPRHGGGPVAKVFYPLPRKSAVLLFQNPADVGKVVKTAHELDGEKLVVTPLPKRVYSSVAAEVDRTASFFMSKNKDVVDELQFIGELGVDFSYEKEAYILTGNWYQLEWALFYLDRTLDAYGVDVDAKQKVRPLRVGHGGRESKTSHRDVGIHEKDQLKKGTHEIKNPNFMRKPIEREEKTRNNAQSGLQAIDHGEYERKSVDRKMTKNKNAAPVHLSKDGTKERASAYSAAAGVGRHESSAGYLGQYHGGRSLSFAADTNFEENKPRPHRMQPPMTSGLDIAMADFGDVPLSYEFEIGRDLKVRILKGDITKQTTDAIVNPTSHDLMGHYGVARAIMSAAGHEMIRACIQHVEEHGDLETTEVMHTSAGGSLSPSMSAVLHVVGPVWNESESESSTHLMVCTYLNCFMYADTKLWLKSFATPLISAGPYGFPLDVCLQAFYDALLLFSRRQAERRHLQEIVLVCFDLESVMASISIVQSLLDCDHATSTAAAAERYNIQAMTTNCSVVNFRMSTYNKGTEKNKNATFEKKEEGNDKTESFAKSGKEIADTVDEETRDDIERDDTEDAHVMDKETRNAGSSIREMDIQEVSLMKQTEGRDESRTEDDMPKGAERLHKTSDIDTSYEQRNNDNENKRDHEKYDGDDFGEEDFKAANAASKPVFDNDEEEEPDVEVETENQDKKTYVEDSDGSENDEEIPNEHVENEHDSIPSSERRHIPTKNESARQQQATISVKCSGDSDDDEPFTTSLHTITAKAAGVDLEDEDVTSTTEMLEEAEEEAALPRDAGSGRRTDDVETDDVKTSRQVEKRSMDNETPSDWSIIRRPDCEGEEEEEQEE